MVDFKLEPIADASDPSSREILFDLLGADNFSKTGHPDGSDFAILIREQAGHAVIGGIWIADDCGWAFVDLLYVPETLQGKQLGRRLLTEAEEMARARGLIGFWTNTYDFQSKGFYEKLGFAEFGRLEGNKVAAGQSFLVKRF